MTAPNNNCDLPRHLYCLLRTEFCNNLREGTEGYVECVVFGAESIPNRALGFHVLREDGALVSQVPAHALCWKECPAPGLSEVEAWDCFGHWLTAHRYEHLAGVEMGYLSPAKKVYSGEYVCTFDFLGNGYSDEPTQHKHLHLIRCDNGWFGLQPNNRVRVRHLSFTDTLFSWDRPPQIETNRLSWASEKGRG